MRYEPAKNPPTATGCQTGTRALGLAIRAVWPEFETLSGAYGCFNRRRIAGSPSWSLHAEGRALDVGVGQAELQLGWELACELVARRIVYGTMRVMFDHHIWSTEHPSEWRRLRSSSNQHTDHIHLEQFWQAALRPAASRHTYERQLRQART